MSEEPKPWKYKALRPWAVWDHSWIGKPGDLYLERLCLIRTPFFQILPHIGRGDRSRVQPRIQQFVQQQWIACYFLGEICTVLTKANQATKDGRILNEQ